MKLYILRHGDAAPHGDPRFKENDRPLTPKGIDRTKKLARALERLEVSFDVILSSPLTRARETAEIVSRHPRLCKQLTFTEHLTPSGRMDQLVGQINGFRPQPRSVLIVGHEPYLTGLISLLCVGGPGLPVQLKKGALCRLDIGTLTAHRCATLEWLVQPKLFADGTFSD
jgi:phosphohistidine phosphatase